MVFVRVLLQIGRQKKQKSGDEIMDRERIVIGGIISDASREEKRKHSPHWALIGREIGSTCRAYVLASEYFTPHRYKIGILCTRPILMPLHSST